MTELRLGAILLLALVWGSARADVADSVVVIEAHRGSSVLHTLAGFVVAQDVVVTNANRLVRADRVVVKYPQLGTELEGDLIYSDERSGLAVVQTLGMAVPPLPLALGEIPSPSTVRVPRPYTPGQQSLPVDGHITQTLDIAADDEGRAFRILQHTAQISSHEFGMPLVNECDQAAGLVRPDPELSRFQLRRDPDPGPLVYALHQEELVAALEVLGLAPAVADEACEGEFKDALDKAEQKKAEAEEAEAAAEEARKAREEAEQRAAEAEQRAKDLSERADASEAEREQAEREAEEARRAAEDARQDAEDREAEAAQLQQAADDARAQAETLEEENRYLYYALAGGGGLLLLVLAIWLIMSRRSKRRLDASRQKVEQAEQALAKAITPASFGCLLEGTGSDGQQYAIKVSAEQLGTATGSVVGRNPARSGVVLDHPEASREHFKLMASGDELFIEDLASTNGTSVNGRKLTPGQVATIKAGDEVGVGSALVLRVRLI